MTNYPPPLFLSFACLWRITIINNYSDRCNGGTTLCLNSTAITILLYFFLSVNIQIIAIIQTQLTLVWNINQPASPQLLHLYLLTPVWICSAELEMIHMAKPYMCVYSSSPLPLQLFWQWAAHQTNALSNHDSSTQPCNTIGPLTTCPE